MEKGIDIKELITHLQVAISLDSGAKNLEAISQILEDITERGIVKPSNTRYYERVIVLLDQLTKKTDNSKYRGNLLEVRHRAEVAKNLINFKQSAKYSSRELASKANLSHSYISRIESCQLKVPSSEAIKNLAMALVIEPQMLDPDYQGDKPDFLLQAYKNPITREILNELDGVNDQTLDFFLRFIKDMNNLTKNNV